MELTIQTPEELVAAVPHLLGFKPEESLVLVPVTKGLPVARVDLPQTPRDCDQVLEGLTVPYGRHARPGSKVAVVCFTDDQGSAELASQQVAAGLAAVGVETAMRLWTDDRRWADLDTADSGAQLQHAADRVATRTVVAGMAMPAESRSAIAASLTGDRTGITQALPAARRAAAASTPGRETRWAVQRLEQFHADGMRLPDPEAARLLVAATSVPIRDTLWAEMTRENAVSHVALWSDLTSRAPEEVRAAPAALTAFSSWLRGDGARAWCALDQVPAEPAYPMADIVAGTLQAGMHPREWDHVRSLILEETPEPAAVDIDDVDESYMPERHGDRTARQPGVAGGRDTPPPSGGPARRPAPGR